MTTIKIQCPCGVKYELDLTPEHFKTGVRFVCQQCGVDSSAAVNQIVRQQFAAQPPPHQPRVQLHFDAPKPATPKAAVSAKVETPPPPTAAAAPAAEPASAAAGPVCFRHMDQPSTSNCLVCQKPICPECMRLFGYVCSAFCAGQAERAGITLPVYEHQKAVVEGRFWKKVRLLGLVVALLLAGLAGAGIWYNFVGSRPRPAFTVKFPEKRRDGFCKIVAEDQVIVRHGSRIVRYDIKNKREVWSTPLLDPEHVEEAAVKWVDDRQFRMEEWKIRRARLKAEGRIFGRDEEDDERPKSEAAQLADARQWVEESMMNAVRFHFNHPDLWVIYTNKVAHLDWESGKLDKEIPLRGQLEEFFPNSTSLLALCDDRGEKILTQIKLPEGEAKSESLKPEMMSTNLAGAKSVPSTKTIPIEIPVRAMSVHFRPEILEGDSEVGRIFRSAAGRYVINSGPNAVDMKVDLIEEKITAHKTMKERPKKSALDGDVNMQATGAIANEIFNEIAEQKGGGVRLEDESRYLVTIRRKLAPGTKDWVGEVNGPPQLFSLKSVDVLTAGKTMIVLDKTNQKLWESKLNYNVSPEMMVGRETWNSEDSEGFMPCVERGQTLFFFDQGVLSAFDLPTGNARWRLPSVGVTSLKFDDKGMMYVMTTSANQEDIKYVDQIDVTRQVVPVLMKVEPQSGKVIWKLNRTGEICFFSGKYFYAVEGSSEDGGDMIRKARAHARIYRLQPRDGRVIWEHLEQGYPIDMDFRDNTILALFPDEMRVLKFLSM